MGEKQSQVNKGSARSHIEVGWNVVHNILRNTQLLVLAL